MRYLSATIAALVLLAPSAMVGQNLSITNYQLVGTESSDGRVHRDVQRGTRKLGACFSVGHCDGDHLAIRRYLVSGRIL